MPQQYGTTLIILRQGRVVLVQLLMANVLDQTLI
jgi:hypothetical protein